VAIRALREVREDRPRPHEEKLKNESDLTITIFLLGSENRLPLHKPIDWPHF
jgi:hypothetical protein